MSDALIGKVAVVTGASRGIGRGTAIALGEQGATVYVTGRTTGDGELTIDTTARLVDEAGGHGIAGARRPRCRRPDRRAVRAGRASSRASSTCWSTTSTRSPIRRRGAAASGITRCRSGTTRSASACARTTWRRGTRRRCCSPPAGRRDHQRLVTRRAELPLQLVVRRRQGRPRPAQRRHGGRAAAEGHRLLRGVPGQRGHRVHPGVGRHAWHRHQPVADDARRRPHHRRASPSRRT